MSRTLSPAAVRELLAQSSGEVFVLLLTLTHASMPAVRLASNTEAVTSRGQVFLAFPFSLDLPADLAEQLVTVQLSISNVDRRLVQALRSIADPIAVTLEVVTAGSPDTVEVGPYLFDMQSVSYNAASITATLSYEPILNEPFPAGSFTPQSFPQLFQRS